jgi:6-phosphogluconolactonase/glucosamine-6-phosphate isomerase/deaminase
MELVVANLDDLRAEITHAFERRAAAGPINCGLAGGPTALIYLAALREAQLDWSQVTFFMADERTGPSESGESHADVARRMLGPVREGRGPRLFAMNGSWTDMEAAAAEYDHVLGRELHDEPLDLAILGVGEDGHVAGLFAGHRALEELTRVAAIDNAPRAPFRRLTMTMSFLISTPEIWIVALGERKRAIVQAAATRTTHASPFDMLLRHAGNVTIFTDQLVQRSNPARAR